jgi:hypothetical protein
MDDAFGEIISLIYVGLTYIISNFFIIQLVVPVVMEGYTNVKEGIIRKLNYAARVMKESTPEMGSILMVKIMVINFNL